MCRWFQPGDWRSGENHRGLQEPIFVGADFQLEVDFWPVFGQFWSVPGVLKSGFSGFIHFPRKRTLSGWTLLFAMGKHTSKEFLYGRKHSRISKCRKTRTKVRSKSGQKWVSRVQSRWVQNDEMSILPGSMVGEKRAKKVKNESKNDPKMMGKSTSKIASGTMSTRPHFSKAGID